MMFSNVRSRISIETLAPVTLLGRGLRVTPSCNRSRFTTRMSSKAMLLRPKTTRNLSSSSSTPSSSSGGGGGGLLAWYSNKLDTHPLITKCLTSGMIAGSGDFICQWTIDGVNWETWDRARTGRFGFLGFALVAPLIHYWYAWLARTIPGTDLVSIAKRVFMDQFVYTPPFLPVWLVSLWTLEGLTDDKKKKDEEPSKSYVDKIIEIFPDIYVANLSLWIPVMALNFRFVPQKYQVLCSNVVALLWNTYLSFSTSRQKQTALEAAGENSKAD